MNVKQKEEYSALKTKSERAKFLLKIGVTAKLDMFDLIPCYRAFVGDTSLIATANTEEDAISAGVTWLLDSIEEDEHSKDQERIAELEEDLENLKCCLSDAEKVFDENVKLRRRISVLTSRAAELHQYIEDRTPSLEHIKGDTPIRDCDFITCIYGLESACFGLCPAEHATGRKDCPARLEVCLACGGSGVKDSALEFYESQSKG